jgi:hypothetical protein
MSGKKNVVPASVVHTKVGQLPRSDQPPSLLCKPIKPDADRRLWMNYRDCRLQQFIASR